VALRWRYTAATDVKRGEGCGDLEKAAARRYLWLAGAGVALGVRIRKRSVTGQTILHYEIREVLGEGNMGVVYKALDRKLDRLVALKFLPSHLAALPDRVERFMQEATALSVVNHPHIATIYDIERVDEQRFLVLEYLPGGTLKTRLEKLQQSQALLPLDVVVEYARQTTEGLAHAHRRGVVHRDVKTSNLMLTEEGNVKITDFGVAKLSRLSSRTVPGSLIGTIRYMSPEQAQGLEADARSDIFSFGVVLFELTTGQTPFQADSDAALLLKIVSSPAPPLKALRADAPDRLDQIVQRALMKRPEDRYQAADELAVDLQALGRQQMNAADARTLSTAAPTVLSVGAKHAAKRWVGALFAVLALFMAGLYLKGQGLPRWVRFPKLPAEKRLALLPFRNPNGDPTDDAFCAGLVEILGSKLGQLEQFQRDLRVISPSEVLKQNIVGARQARDAFGATLALTGSILRSKDKVVFVTELVDTQTQLVLDSRNLEAPATELPQLQDRLVNQIAAMLRLNVRPDARPPGSLGLTQKASAYESYLEGLGYLQRYDRSENIDKALKCFAKALAQDPQFALAFAAQAETYLRRYQMTKDGKSLVQARISCQQAIGLNDQLSAVHLTMGLIHSSAGEYQDAIISFESALKFQPESADAYRELANAYASAGRFDNAEATFRKAIELRPDVWMVHKDLGVFLIARGRLEDAVSSFRRVVSLTPDNYVGYNNLGGLYTMLGEYSNAESALRKSLSLYPSEGAYSNLGTIFFLQGHYREAGEMYKKAVELNSDDPDLWGNLGDAYRWGTGKSEEFEPAYRRAIALSEKQLESNPMDTYTRAKLAMFWSDLEATQRPAGAAQAALRQISEALRPNPTDGFVLARAAVVYEQCRMREQALATVKAAIKAGYAIAEIRNWPSLAELRRDPRYQEAIDNRSDFPSRSAVPR
jgi:tetratricopeptide (TPR) repeat protein